MIAGIFHEGSGLGNQLHRYVAVRCLAKDLGVPFGMVNPHLFKGHTFIKLDMGTLPYPSKMAYFQEKRVNHDRGGEGIDVRDYDFDIQKVKDNTLIEGEFQDERYWIKHEKELNLWLQTDTLEVNKNMCVINFRGGEYKYFPDLYLTKDYWDKAVNRMKKINPKMFFQVRTDDVYEAQKFFPDFPVLHEMATDWLLLRYAKYIILSNSSFGILPAWLNKNARAIIAPKYWARRNIKIWSMKQNRYTRFTHL